MRPRLDRDEVKKYIVDYYAANDQRPTTEAAAADLGCSGTALRAAVLEMDAANELPGVPRGRREGRDKEEKLLKVMDFIAEYMKENTWAPSRREIAEGVGMNLSGVNTLVAILASKGRIEVGTESRQIRITKKGKR